MTDRSNVPQTPVARPGFGLDGSAALVADQHRVRHNRAIASRALTRRRWRRRVLPPLAVTSAVMLGTGTAGAWVHAALTTKSSPATGSRDATQLAGLDQLRQQLAADQQTLASLISAPPLAPTASGGSSAATTTAPAPGQLSTAAGAGAGQPLTTTASHGPAATKPLSATSQPAAGSKPSGAGAPAGGQPAAPPAPTVAPAPTAQPAPKPTTAPAPAPTTKPPAPPPTVQATTGASGAKP